jgi:hypothetical protein
VRMLLGSPMTWRRTSLLLGVVGLCLALAPQPATATLVVGEASPSSVGHPDNLLESLASQLLASAEMAGPATPVSPNPAPSEDNENDPPVFRLMEGLLPAPATGCQSNSVSQWSGSTGVALASRICDVPPPRLWAALPSEAKTILPTGPPFELLRPPRIG